MAHEKTIGVGAHPEEDVHQARDYGKKGMGPEPESQALINRYALERARAGMRPGRRAKKGRY